MQATSTAKKSGKSPIQTLVPAALLAVVVGGLALIFWPGKTRTVTVPQPVPGSTPAPAPEAGAPPEVRKSLQPLIGNWVREDGGYRLAIEGVESDGRLKAAYFNPNPIRVSLAKATNEVTALKAHVELNDVGYPGCIYSLTYDSVNDRLVGTYFQAAMREMYEVMFIRTP